MILKLLGPPRPAGDRPAPSLSRISILALAIAALVAGLIGAFVFLAVRVNALRGLRATGPAWSFPSRVYSDGVPLLQDRVLPESHVLAELAARRYRETREEHPAPGFYRRVPSQLVIGLRGFLEGPDPEGRGGPERIRVTFADSVIARVERLGAVPGAAEPDWEHPPRLEPTLVSYLMDEDRVRRSYVALERVPREVQDAIVVAEDRRFFEHFGIDPRGSARALVANVRSKDIVQGGSTITQQLARGLFLGNERTFTRKLAEIPLAIGLEILLSKQQILEMYLNMVYWGQSSGGGVAGIAEAARWYFDVPVESLGTAEGALLAALIPAPNAITPFEHPDLALEKRNVLLGELAEQRKISREVAAELAAHPLGVRQGPTVVERFPSYSGYVRDVLARRIHRRAAETRGLSIFTTMDLGWQETAENGMQRGLAVIEGRIGRRRPHLEGAFVALEAGTGAVRALVGGRRVKSGDFNRATQALRQPGSAIKPIVYAAALADPIAGFTPATTFSDERRVFGKGRWAWRPRNFGDSYHPSVTLAFALSHSLNVATANLVEAIGPWTVAQMGRRMGLGSLKPVLSIGLGSNEVSLLALTRAYAAFADAGMLREPTPIRAVVDSRGARYLQQPGPAEDALPPGIAAVMTGLLQDVVIYGVGRSLRSYGFDRPVAGKTGTTNDFLDGWFVGYTPHVVAGVWVGYDEPRSLGRQAAHSALPIWAWIVHRMIGGFPKMAFASDAEIEYRDIDPYHGSLAEQGGCPAMRVPFLPGTAPLIACGWESDTLFAYEDAVYDTLGIMDTTGVLRDPFQEDVPALEDTTWESNPDTTSEDSY